MEKEFGNAHRLDHSQNAPVYGAVHLVTTTFVQPK